MDEERQALSCFKYPKAIISHLVADWITDNW